MPEEVIWKVVFRSHNYEHGKILMTQMRQTDYNNIKISTYTLRT